MRSQKQSRSTCEIEDQDFQAESDSLNLYLYELPFGKSAFLGLLRLVSVEERAYLQSKY